MFSRQGYVVCFTAEYCVTFVAVVQQELASGSDLGTEIVTYTRTCVGTNITSYKSQQASSYSVFLYTKNGIHVTKSIIG